MFNPDTDGKIFVGKSDKPEMLTLAFGNRHGLVTGATGTGKTVTLQTMAEGFSRAGVPVFAADIKGDLSGIAVPGERKEAFVKRAKDLGFEYETDEFPVVTANDPLHLGQLMKLTRVEPDRIGSVSDRALNRLADPPDGVSRQPRLVD